MWYPSVAMVVHHDNASHSLKGKRITAEARNGCSSAKPIRAFVSLDFNSTDKEFSMRFDESFITRLFDKFRRSL